jgi:hypothetical protein
MGCGISRAQGRACYKASADVTAWPHPSGVGTIRAMRAFSNSKRSNAGSDVCRGRNPIQECPARALDGRWSDLNSSSKQPWPEESPAPPSAKTNLPSFQFAGTGFDKKFLMEGGWLHLVTIFFLFVTRRNEGGPKIFCPKTCSCVLRTGEIASHHFGVIVVTARHFVAPTQHFVAPTQHLLPAHNRITCAQPVA